MCTKYVENSLSGNKRTPFLECDAKHVEGKKHDWTVQSFNNRLGKLNFIEFAHSSRKNVAMVFKTECFSSIQRINGALIISFYGSFNGSERKQNRAKSPCLVELSWPVFDCTSMCC